MPERPDDDEEEVGFDPRWEVQPQLEEDDAAARGSLLTRLGLAVVALVGIVLVWGVLQSPPAL